MMLLEDMVMEDMYRQGYNPSLITHIKAYWAELLS